MKIYDETQPLYLETDASGVRLAAAYNLEVGQAAQETRHLTTAYLEPLHSPAKTCQVWKGGTVTLRERH